MLSRGIILTSDNQRISYCHYKNNHDRLIIIVHGFFNSKDSVLLTQLARDLSSNYDVFMFDFRGHGKSSGVFTWTSREDRDLTAVLEYLSSKYQKKAVVAFSLGASISINVLSKRTDINSLICVSAVSEFAKIDYRFWRLDWENDIVYSLLTKEGRQGKGVRPGPFWFKKQRAVDCVEQLKIPVFYIHGSKDQVVKPWHSQLLYEKTPSQKKITTIKDGPHAEYLLRKFRKNIQDQIKEWLELTF